MDIEEKIAGEIALSDNFGKTLQKWREEFIISKTELAKQMDVPLSMITDYESGRRKSPGIAFTPLTIVYPLMYLSRSAEEVDFPWILLITFLRFTSRW